MKILNVFLVCLLGALALGACDDYDSWTTDGSARLTFSVDTVAFDTVVTGMSSTTRTLIVSNDNTAGLHIQRVALGKGDRSPFRVNVDGQYLAGGVGEEFEVRRRDSIYVRAEVLVPETEGNEMVHMEDQLTFTLESGVQQHVTLVADGMNVYVVRGLDIKRDTTLLTDRPYIIYDSLVVEAGATLTLQPGTTLMMHEGVNIDVHGSLRAQGTLEQPVVLRGDRVDNLFDYLPYDNTPNRWGGVHIYGESTDNVLTQCDIHSGEYGIVCDSALVLDVDHPTLVMENCIIHNVGGTALDLNNVIVQAIGCQISNAAGRCVSVLGGACDFVHCTITQFYPFVADRGDALYLANVRDEEIYCHLYWANFLNCVITGYAEDVIMGSISEGSDYRCEYRFDHCLLRTIKSDDEERFVDINWDLDEKGELDTKPERHFTVFDTKNFIYDFTPDSASVIRGLADPEWTKTLSPIDRRGVSRMADGAPDAGCYEGMGLMIDD